VYCEILGGIQETKRACVGVRGAAKNSMGREGVGGWEDEDVHPRGTQCREDPGKRDNTNLEESVQSQQRLENNQGGSGRGNGTTGGTEGPPATSPILRRSLSGRGQGTKSEGVPLRVGEGNG